MRVNPSSSYRKQKENRTKSSSLLYNSPPTNHIYPATRNVSYSPDQIILGHSYIKALQFIIYFFRSAVSEAECNTVLDV